MGKFEISYDPSYLFVEGVDEYGDDYSFVLSSETARKLIFTLHRQIIGFEKLKLEFAEYKAKK